MNQKMSCSCSFYNHAIHRIRNLRRFRLISMQSSKSDLEGEKCISPLSDNDAGKDCDSWQKKGLYLTPVYEPCTIWPSIQSYSLKILLSGSFFDLIFNCSVLRSGKLLCFISVSMLTIWSSKTSLFKLFIVLLAYIFQRCDRLRNCLTDYFSRIKSD